MQHMYYCYIVYIYIYSKYIYIYIYILYYIRIMLLYIYNNIYIYIHYLYYGCLYLYNVHNVIPSTGRTSRHHRADVVVPLCSTGGQGRDGGDGCRRCVVFLKSMDWFSWENLQETMVFTIKYRVFL